MAKKLLIVIMFSIPFVWLLGMQTSRTKNFGSVRVDENLVEKFKALDNPENLILRMNSHGGLPNDGHKISKFMRAWDISIVIDKECLSACAEIILPSASNVHLKNSPMVGYHWNSIMNFELLERFGANLKHCDLNEVYDQINLLEYKKMNISYWKETEKRLELSHFKVIPKNGKCPWKERTFQNHMWLPTSNQLLKIMRLNFNGSVCADDFPSCSRKIDRRWKKGTRIVIGDEVYVSKGY